MKGLFIPPNVFLSVIYFSINHFSVSLSIFLSLYLHLFLCCSFLSLRDLRPNEQIQMRLSVGGCRSFPASFSWEGRKKSPLFGALEPCVRTSSMKVYNESVSTVCMCTQIYTHNVYTWLSMCPPLDRIISAKAGKSDL